ncbi:MAG: helix-turn-helix domain-containing protein [Syntrophales bacterium]
MEEKQERRLLTVSEIAAYLSIKQKTIYAKVEAREIPHFKIGHLIRFRLDEIDAWLGGCRQDKKPEAGQQKIKGKRRKTSGRTNDYFGKIVTKIIDAETDKYYSLDYGKSDQSKGLRKEVEHGPI